MNWFHELIFPHPFILKWQGHDRLWLLGFVVFFLP